MKNFYRMYLGDCLEKFSFIPSESIDLVITDPPYDIEQENKLTKQKGKIVSTTQAWGGWTSSSFQEYDCLIKTTIDEITRVLLPGGSCYIWLDREKIGLYNDYAKSRGLTHNNMIVWVKTNPMPHFRKTNYRSAFEQAIWLSKGKPKTFNFLEQSIMKNVYYSNNTIRTTNHPTEKPLDLIEWHIKVSSNRGETILDPFMGSGTTMAACQNLGRNCIGIEKNPEYYEIIRKRCYGKRFLDRETEYDFS